MHKLTIHDLIPRTVTYGKRRTSRMTKAFRELRKLGYWAKQDWQCCSGCGWSAIPEGVDRSKVVFYHSQDKERFDETGRCQLRWAGSGPEIVRVMKQFGFAVEWNGRKARCIQVTDLDWVAILGVTKVYGTDFMVEPDPRLGNPKYTLEPEYVCKDHDDQIGFYTRKHRNGWTISGNIYEDAFYWVTDFRAYHPKYGYVWGNFEDKVHAESEDAYQHFVKRFPPHAWDGDDI